MLQRASLVSTWRRVCLNRPVQAVLQLGIAAGLVWIWGRGLDWGRVGHLVFLHQAGWLPAVVVLAVLASVLRAWRWKLVIARQSRVGLVRVFWINEGANLANILIPARVGDLLRMFWLRRACRLPAGKSAGTVMADHALELGVATVLLVGAALVALVHPASGSTGPLVADAGAALLLLGLLAVVVLVVPGMVRSASVARRLPSRAATWLRLQSRHFEEAGPVRVTPRVAGAAVALTIAAFGADALMLTTLFKAMGMGLPVIASMMVCLTLVPGYALPLPGGIGIVELIGTFAVQAGGGMENAAAAAGVLAWHAAGIAITLVLGTVAIMVLGRPRREPEGEPEREPAEVAA